MVLNGAGAVRVGLVVVSDRASSGQYEDKSGPAMAHILTGTTACYRDMIHVYIVETYEYPLPEALGMARARRG